MREKRVDSKKYALKGEKTAKEEEKKETQTKMVHTDKK